MVPSWRELSAMLTEGVQLAVRIISAKRKKYNKLPFYIGK